MKTAAKHFGLAVGP